LPQFLDPSEFTNVQPIPGACGSFGEVSSCTFRDILAAIKVPRNKDPFSGVVLPFSPAELRQQNMEYTKWAELPRHPCVLPVYGAFKHPEYKSLCLVSPLMKSGSLDQVLSHPDANGVLPWDDQDWSLMVSTQVAQGIAHLHDNNFLHLDSTTFIGVF
jgi:serine/threonine protein kinase